MTRKRLLARFDDSELPTRTLPQEELYRWERDVLATYSPSRGAIRPEMLSVYNDLAANMRYQRTPASFRQAIEYELKALRCVGFVIIDRRTAPRSKRSKEVQLPIDTSVIPTAIRFREPVIDMLTLAYTYYCGLSDVSNASQWLLAARWVTTSMLAGGTPLFLQMWGPVLETFRLKALAEQVL